MPKIHISHRSAQIRASTKRYNSPTFSTPGGMAILPFMKGGLAKAGMACIGGPGLNCIVAYKAPL